MTAPGPVQGVSMNFYGVRRHTVYRNTAIGFFCVCDDTYEHEFLNPLEYFKKFKFFCVFYRQNM